MYNIANKKNCKPWQYLEGVQRIIFFPKESYEKTTGGTYTGTLRFTLI